MQALIARAERSADGDRQLLEFCDVFYAEANPSFLPEGEARLVTADEFAALLTIRQWQRVEPGAPRSALQQVARTLVGIAAGYFASTPGAVSERRPAARLLIALLRTVNDLDLAHAPPRGSGRTVRSPGRPRSCLANGGQPFVSRTDGSPISIDASSTRS